MDQNHSGPYRKQTPVAAQQKQVDAGWRNLERISAAQHLYELSNVSRDQIHDVVAACMSLVMNSSSNRPQCPSGRMSGSSSST
jgi:hypothetical protein